MAALGFAVIGGEPLPEMVPFGLLDGLPSEVLGCRQVLSRLS
jgi:hypothetical protein